MLPKTTLNILKYNDKFEILSVVTDKTNYYYSTNYFYLTNNKNTNIKMLVFCAYSEMFTSLFVGTY